ncbi:MAG: IS1634 family transposase [Pseudolabrys sp.]
MFVRVKKIGAYEYLYLVENAREGGRHVQRVIKALGRRDEVEASGLIDGLIASAARHSRRSIVLSSFYRGQLPELHRLSIGPDLVFGRLWAEMGCRNALKSLVADRRFSFDVERAVYLTVLHRLMISGSDRHANDWCSRVRVPGAEGLDLDHAYKAMAWLGEVDAAGRSTAEAVEEALYRHRQPLFGAVSIAFLDTTTLWFEGAGGESLGQYGHSKDYRGHLKQVVLGIVLDDADRPIASFLMPGNTADVTLLLPVVKRLRERFGIREACIVADRGIISADTIAALEAEKIEYILGVRERTSREVRAEIIEDDGLAVPLLIPRQKGETELAVRETTIAGRRYVICRNAEEAKKDAAARAELVAGLERKLAQGDKALVANKGFRRFLKTPEGDGFVIDRAKVEADARFDGLFVLRTNTKIAALQVVLRYRNLLAVEDAFKTAKALLATRPIFHKTDAGIRGHVFCTFLALVLRKELIDRLAVRRSRLEWQRIVDDLADLSEIDVEQDGRRARLRTAPGPTIDPICRAIGIALPPVFQEMPPVP